MRTITSGLFDSSSKSALAISELSEIGLLSCDIMVVANDSYTAEDFAINNQHSATKKKLIEEVVARFTQISDLTISGAKLLVSGSLLVQVAEDDAGAMNKGIPHMLLSKIIPSGKVKFYTEALEEGSILLSINHLSESENSINAALALAGAKNLSTK